MDPSIVKLLEEDEDESMHSGAALNRNIEGDAPTIIQSSDSSETTDAGVFLQGGQTGVGKTQKHAWHSSEMEQKHHGSVPECQQQQQLNDNSREFTHHRQSSTEEMAARSSSMPLHEPGNLNSPRPSDSQYLKVQKISKQQQQPFAMLLPALLSQLDPDRAMQLRTLYGRLKKNEIAKEGFVRHLKSIVADKVLSIAVQKLNAQLNSQAPRRSSRAMMEELDESNCNRPVN